MSATDRAANPTTSSGQAGELTRERLTTAIVFGNKAVTNASGETFATVNTQGLRVLIAAAERVLQRDDADDDETTSEVGE